MSNANRPSTCVSSPFPTFALLALALFFSACQGNVGSEFASIQVIGGAGRGVGFLHQPRAIEAFADGSCVVIDRTGRVQRFNSAGEFSQSWFLPEYRDGQPIDLVRTPWQSLIVADTHYGRLLEYSFDGELLRKFGDPAELDLVRGVGVDAAGIIYVADYGEHGDRVHRFKRDGSYLGHFASRGEGPDQLQRPEGLTIGQDGNIYVVDCAHHRILCFTPTGEFVRSIGSAGKEEGHFLFPFDIATGSDNSLYIVDFRGNRVQRFSQLGEFLGAKGGAGIAPGKFATPRGIAVIPDAEGDWIFIADTNNHRIQKFRWQ